PDAERAVPDRAGRAGRLLARPRAGGAGRPGMADLVAGEPAEDLHHLRIGALVMTDPSPSISSGRPSPPARPDVSLGRVLAEAAGLLVVLGAVGAWVFRVPEAGPVPSPEVASVAGPAEAPQVVEPLPIE